MRAWLIFLGKANDAPVEHRLIEPQQLGVGETLPLELRHPERWRRRDVTRIIIGSDPSWADVVLVDDPLTIAAEHARFYLNHAVPDASDFRPTKGGPAIINGKITPRSHWVNVHNGDEIQMSCWRFRYEWAG